MSPDNRSNPDKTDINGHFGWDVFPGYYRVTATSKQCKGSAVSKVYAVPPPVTDIKLVLNCPHLKRKTVKGRVLSVKKNVVTVQLKGAVGVVTAGKTFAFLDKHGRAKLVLPKAVKHVKVRFAGNARFAPATMRK